MPDQDARRPSRFLDALCEAGFAGDVADDGASRLVGATDNSIYHIVPDAILFPAHAKDVVLAAQLAAKMDIALTARGGGTGTNGQSLNTGVVLDTSRHMNRVLDLDLDAGTVAVEPGVVLDQLNAALHPHGYFFAPTVSTSSRATLGGMFATDASGKGSRVYGRMSDHVLSADLVLASGQLARITPDRADGALSGFTDWLGPALDGEAREISQRFPRMNRGLTGYNLDQARSADGGVNFIKLIAGSEGTLALTTELSLRILPLPTHSGLTVLAYDSFAAALEHVPHLAAAQATAIEFLDDKILALAAASPMWSELEGVLGDLRGAGGFLFVEFTGMAQDEVSMGQAKLAALLAVDPGGLTARISTGNKAEVNALWELRKRAVGLLAAVETHRIGLPFVEDAAVPPENLASFVAEFSGILSAHGLDFGMFGHADVGCVHVRPMLDMRDAGDRAMIRIVSDQVAALCRRHGGLIWGEHGKGMRGEYVERYVGPDLHGLMRQIKAAFDPANRLNPGKLVTAVNTRLPVVRLDTAPMRGERDQEIDMDRHAALDRALACNGNGACHNWAPDDPMCPSFKVTRDKRQAPKGRASLFREWGHLRSVQGPARDIAELEEALAESLSTCLSCKSCTGQCPVRVDIPAMKSIFLEHFYRNRRRPPRDHLLRQMEGATLVLRHSPQLANMLLGNPLSRALLSRVFALADSPRFSRHTVEAAARAGGARMLTRDVREFGPDPVCIVTDSFTGVFETGLVEHVAALLTRLSHTVWVTPPLANGKALEVRGFRSAFSRRRARTLTGLNRLAAHDLPLIGVEPAVLDLFLRDDEEAGTVPEILSLDLFLHDRVETLPQLPQGATRHALFLHCTEKSADPAAGRRWQKIFGRLGLHLDLPATGCCGMAGLFGHEAEHQDLSRDLFDLSWRTPLEEAGPTALATGFSCRSQARRLGPYTLPHPAAALLARVVEIDRKDRT